MTPISIAPNPNVARAALEELTKNWGSKYGAVMGVRVEEFVPFLDYQVEIRMVICSTSAGAHINARYRRAVRREVISRPHRRRCMPALNSFADSSKTAGRPRKAHNSSGRTQR